MAIRLANNCENCENLSSNNMCSKHHVQVNNRYTCDSFEMKAAFKDDRNCVTCMRFEADNCANPSKAAPGMLCASWAPQAEA